MIFGPKGDHLMSRRDGVNEVGYQEEEERQPRVLLCATLLQPTSASSSLRTSLHHNPARLLPAVPLRLAIIGGLLVFELIEVLI